MVNLPPTVHVSWAADHTLFCTIYKRFTLNSAKIKIRVKNLLKAVLLDFSDGYFESYFKEYSAALPIQL